MDDIDHSASRPRRRPTPSREPGKSAAEKQAQRWHNERHLVEGGKCWCCCNACAQINPHYPAACAAVAADIAARINASMNSTRAADTTRRLL